MVTQPTTRSTYDVSGYSDLLSDEWKAFLLTPNGRLKWGAVRDQYSRGGVLPAQFLERFQQAHPGINLPPRGDGAGYDGPEDEPREELEPVTNENDITEGGTRQFTWKTATWKQSEDRLNKRRADGTLIALTANEYSGEITEGEVQLSPTGQIPNSLLTREMLDHWSAINDVNGKVYYDSERFALGDLTAEEYMLVPSNMAIPICEIKNIGGGLNAYDPGMLLIAGVYSLAKAQAVALSMSSTDQVKWAALRLEAFKAGWFNHQKYTAYKPMPANSIATFVADGRDAIKAMRDAWPLCAFLPFLTEFYFRSYGGCYNQKNAADYVAKAQKLAAGATLSDYLNYLPADTLYAKALSWIGVVRPKAVLLDQQASRLVPNVFKIRITSAPAGQAMITTSATIIDALRGAHWWEGIAQTGNYNDDILTTVAGEIKRNPWKYHMYSFAYEMPPLTQEEADRVEEARRQAQMFAPILQAYIDAITQNHDLGRAQALKKFSMNNFSLYSNALSLFKSVKRQKGKTVAELFANTVFGVRPASLEGPNNTTNP